MEPAPSGNCNPDSADRYSRLHRFEVPPSPPFATPETPLRSRIARIIRQIDDRTTAFWTPDAVHRRISVNRSNGPDTIPARPSGFDNRTHQLTIIPKHTNNSRPDTHATSFFNPAFDIHLPWLDYRPKCYQHSDFATAGKLTDNRQQRNPFHFLPAKPDTRPYNPAFDLHPTRPFPRTITQQTHTCFSVATYVPGFAQNKRPP